MTAIIPVIDLMRGQVVRAMRGDRKAYRPIVSALCASSDPVQVASILCAHCDSRRLYVADLDALQGEPVQVVVLIELLKALPDIELWLDAGLADDSAASTLLSQLGELAARVVLVFGSESLRSREALQACFASNADANTADASAPEQKRALSRVLSLDRREGRRLDAAGCWDAPELWPGQVIVMTLERVGSDAGPDLETLAEVRRRAPDVVLIGAGGIRDEADLARASDTGADAWLIASALHDLRLPVVRRSVDTLSMFSPGLGKVAKH